jgi:hypothetical protein
MLALGILSQLVCMMALRTRRSAYPSEQAAKSMMLNCLDSLRDQRHVNVSPVK